MIYVFSSPVRLNLAAIPNRRREMRGLLRTRDGQTTGLRNGESLRTDRTRGQSDDTDGQTEIGKEDREGKKRQ